MQRLGLSGWVFTWDRAKKRLGCCNMTRQRISLSGYFVLHYLERDPQLITETILHEIAHALAWVHYRERGHGLIWRQFCEQLGMQRVSSTTPCDDFEQAAYRYALIIETTGEVIRRYTRRPKMTVEKLKTCYIPKRKAETLGKLAIVALS